MSNYHETGFVQLWGQNGLTAWKSVSPGARTGPAVTRSDVMLFKTEIVI